MTESAVVNSCLRYLWFLGCDVIRNNTAAFRSTYRRKDGSIGSSYVRTGKKGSGDILACSPNGRWIEIECKFGKGKQQPHQLARQEEIQRRNGIYIVAYSIEDIEKHKAEILA